LRANSFDIGAARRRCFGYCRRILNSVNDFQGLGRTSETHPFFYPGYGEGYCLRLGGDRGDDVRYQNLPVTVVGIGGGVNYSTLGSSHHAREDVALACVIPNISVIAPCDPAERRLATDWCTTQQRAPVHFRLGKAGEPDLTRNAVDPRALELLAAHGLIREAIISSLQS
jgi:hypothetical protein